MKHRLGHKPVNPYNKQTIYALLINIPLFIRGEKHMHPHKKLLLRI